MKQNLATRLINIAALTIGGAALWMAAAASTAAASTVVARIDVSDQTMQVIVDGQPTYEWKVSTAGRGYRTPRGTFSPTRMHKMWYSRKYDNAPMPHSIFFHGGYAVHATDAVKRLGQPASHGCVRLHPKNAASLYSLVKSHGSANMRIVIVD
ncbi:L,D-transpeptidase [Aquibium sp. LZ166]|uniref:L,D-transpeptidase n=1 Tax=Aquibium pacificus TaxID=3153579 RepID=A0ABV3SHY2_9HYPH